MEKSIVKSVGAFSPAALVNRELFRFVNALPQTGEEGYLYLVDSGETRDEYVIWQEFVWKNNDWEGIGAFDMSINPTGIMYVRSFDTTTNTLNTTASL